MSGINIGMTIGYLILLSAIQGLTEFLPVSSSAHLALLPALSNMTDQGRFMDVAAHVGSLLAVMWHYRVKVFSLLRFNDIALMWKLILSFLPVLAFGLFIPEIRGTEVIAVNLVLFGILLWVADKYGRSDKSVSNGTAFIVGFAQALALIPGISRSGITISAMRARGVERTAALDFAFLMSMPAIAAAGLWALLSALQSPEVTDWTAAFITMIMSCLFSLFAIRFMLGFVKRFSFGAFAVYRILLGIILLAF